MKKDFLISGLSGSSCAKQVEKYVRKLDGVDSVRVNVASGTMRVSFDDLLVRPDDIISAVSNAGYVTRLAEKPAESTNDGRNLDPGLSRMLAMWLLTLGVMYLSLTPSLNLPSPDFLNFPLPAGLMQMLLLAPVMLLSGEIFSGGIKSLRHFAPNMFTLVSVGAAASAAYSVFEIIMGAWKLSAGESYTMHLYFDTSAMILALVALGKFFEARARLSTSAAIARLSRMRPEIARVMRDGKERTVQATEILPGETVVVRKGDIIPADGVVLSGEGTVDSTVFTGENAPVTVSMGDEVLGASVCMSGEFALRAIKPLKDMRLTQILSLVEEASATKAPIARTADRIAGAFVPLVMLLSVITGIVWACVGSEAAFAIKTAVCVLVISCPCALGLATPTAIMAGTGKGAEMGILIKNASAMQKLSAIDTVIFDKAGTLTAGEMRVSGCVLSDGASIRSLIALAASAEQHSQHPLALAILKKARELDLPLDPVNDYEIVPGQGVRASVGGMRVLVGNLTLMEQSAQDVSVWKNRAGELADSGASTIYVAADGRVRGLIALRDELRPTAIEAVQMLEQMGVHTMMLTGDDQRTADAIARKAGVSEAKCNLNPDDKDMMMRILQADGKKVMLVSDGAKDAPAFTRAELSVTVCGGTDFAIESAEVVVMRGDMRLVASALQLGRLSIRVIRENLFWAFFYNVIGIPLAAGVLYPLFGLEFSPMLAAAVMCLASIFVVFNALRLRRFKPTEQNAPRRRHRLRGSLSHRMNERAPRPDEMWVLEE